MDNSCLETVIERVAGQMRVARVKRRTRRVKSDIYERWRTFDGFGERN